MRQKISSLNDLPTVAAYLSRIGAEPRGLRSAIIREQSGKYWKDIEKIHFAKDGTVTAENQSNSPTDQEAALIKSEFAGVTWPEPKRLFSLIDVPDMIKNASPEDIYEFRDEENMIVMVQVRIQIKDGKRYVPWTYWSDDEWRAAEPEGKLPLFNANKLNSSTTVFVHEGAKAARSMQTMIEEATPNDRERMKAHPWGIELSGAVHVGWIGGALSPYRTDWSMLAKSGIKRVYIVADNDPPGVKAVPAIAQQLQIPTFTIQFTDEFPVSFDLADEFPEKMFSSMDGHRYYTGPAFRDCLHPATWATNLIPNQRGKPTPILRDSFSNMWAYVEEADVFVCKEMPTIVRAEPILNKMVAAFSHTFDTGRLIVKSYHGRSPKLCYRPDEKGLVVTHKDTSAINLHVPSVIRAASGDIEPWIEFLRYMFPREGERKEIERWCATLIARPDIRMGYGLLLVSEHQGIGKTTLGANILAPLVGYHNVGFPSESDILGAFNDWMSNKRLVVIGEIYSGSSWKAYHSLKSVITDREITVNQKYIRPYLIENWCHVIASSNSMRALKMENDDRRWFYPEITEVPWPQEKFVYLRAWLERGGLSIIKRWADEYGNYVRSAERAPMTRRKEELIDGSRSEAQREVAGLAEAVVNEEKPVALLMKEVIAWVRNQVQGRVFDSDYELRKTMVEVGLKVFPERVKIHGMMHYVIMNDLLFDLVMRIEDENEKRSRLNVIREHVIKVTDIITPEM
jgi:hypothetical protein